MLVMLSETISFVSFVTLGIKTPCVPLVPCENSLFFVVVDGKRVYDSRPWTSATPETQQSRCVPRTIFKTNFKRNTP